MHHSTDETKGSLYCKPREVLQGSKKITVAVDIYAYGCLVQTLLGKNLEYMHPFGDLENRKDFKNNVINGKRIYFLTSEKEKTDLFILADLAVDDATNIAYKERPDICTFTEHPLFWTTKRKGLFLKDINNDCIKNDEKQSAFLTDFSNMLPLRFVKGSDGFLRWTKNSSEFGRILQYKIQEKRIKDSSYDTTYPNLITFVRNICEHFPEHKKIFKDDADVLRVLGDNKTSFIECVLNKYPYLIADIFKSFRKALLSGKCLNDDYDVYFENLCSKKILCRPGDSITGVAQSLDDGMQNLGLKNNLPWRDLVNKDTITKDDILNLDCKNLRPYIMVELVLKFVSQTDATGADIDDLSKKFLVDNIALMDAEYYYCVNYEVKNLQMLGVKQNSKHGCNTKLVKMGYTKDLYHMRI